MKRSRVLAGSGTLALLVAAGLSPAAPSSAAAGPVLFHYTGAVQTYVVPADGSVCGVTVQLVGGTGGETFSGGFGSYGGAGGKIAGTFPVSPGDTVQIFVGEGGHDGSAAGGDGAGGATSGNAAAHGGSGGTAGTAGTKGAGGGGATVVQLNGSERLTAGGGGGGGPSEGQLYQGISGGAGGIFPSLDGEWGGFGPSSAPGGGLGGTSGAGGTGGAGAGSGGAGTAGAALVGGAGGDGNTGSSGGGGGGGWFGGGGGGGGGTPTVDAARGGGGGGGSSHADAVVTALSAGTAVNDNQGNGEVVLDPVAGSCGGNPVDQTDDDDELPPTGAAAGPVIGAGLAVVAAGLAFLGLAARRRPARRP